MAINVTKENVRTECGADEKLINDTDVDALITKTKLKTLARFGVNEDPIKTIEIGQSKNRLRYLILRRFPLKILSIKQLDTEIDLDKIYLNRITGLISYKNSGMFPSILNSVKIKYLDAFMEKTKIVKENSAAIEKGDSKTFTLDDVSNLEIGDWIFIEGTDRNSEIAKITNIDTLDITVDKLVHDHEAESLITKMQTSQLLNDFVLYEVCLAVSLRAIGTTYTFNTGYTTSTGKSVQKGIPYPHFDKQVNKFTKLRDEVKRQIVNTLQVWG